MMSGAGLDGVIVINLDRRPDRWAAFQSDWRDILPWEKVIRLPATDGQAIAGFGQRPWFQGRKRDLTWAGRAGCALSHARAMREARARGWDRVLVLEDDAVPSREGGLPAAVHQGGWDILYLGGGKPQNVCLDDPSGLTRIHGALDLHAYAVTSGARDWLAESLPDEPTIWSWIAREGAVDRWMRREAGLRFNVLMCRPLYAAQRAGRSDITQRAVTDYGSDEISSEPSNVLIRNGERVRNALQWGRRRVFGF